MEVEILVFYGDFDPYRLIYGEDNHHFDTAEPTRPCFPAVYVFLGQSEIITQFFGGFKIIHYICTCNSLGAMMSVEADGAAGLDTT